MKPNNNLTSFCIRKIPNQPFNNKEIKKFSAKYGIVESIKDGGDLLFVNFSKITDLEACMEFFRINGFVVEPSKRNKAQNQSNQQQQKQQETRSKPRSSVSKENLSVLMNSSEVGKQNGIPSSNNSDKKESGKSNLSTMKSSNGNCILCQRQTSLFCQRCHDFYCSVDCQMKDWQSHRYICFPIPKLIDVSQLYTDIQPQFPQFQVMQQQPLLSFPPFPVNSMHQHFFQNPPIFVNQNRTAPVQNSNNSKNMPLQIINPSQSSNVVSSSKSDNKSSVPAQKDSKTIPKSNTSNDNSISKKAPGEQKMTQQQNPSPTPSSKSTLKNKSSNPKLQNTSLTNKTSETMEKLERLKLLQDKNSTAGKKSESSDDSSGDEQDASTLEYLKTIAAHNKVEREKSLASNISRSSSLKSICPNVPSALQGVSKFPENRSSCLIVGKDLIRSSVFIRSTNEKAVKEYNEIINFIAEIGLDAPDLEKRPRVGDQVLGNYNGIYCRALVVNFISIHEIFLLFIDTGEQGYLKLSDLKNLPSEFRKLKVYTFNAKLRNCSGTFGGKAQSFIQDLIDRSVQIRVEYAGDNSTSKSLVNDVVCDLYIKSTNEYINELLNKLQEQDDC